MYQPKLPVAGVSFLALGISEFYNVILMILLIVTVTLVLFRFTRLLIKEGTFSKFISFILVLLSMLLLIIVLGKYETYNKIKQSDNVLAEYKNVVNINNNRISYNKSDENIIMLKNENEINKPNPESGDILGLIYIEKIGLELPIIEEATDDNLWIGAAHMKGTPLYWEKGNSFLSSHNVKNYGKLFNRLNELTIGDKIVISDNDDKYSYVVYDVKIVEPNDTDCFEKIKGEYNITLVTCTRPRGKRLIVYCERINEENIELVDLN